MNRPVGIRKGSSNQYSFVIIHCPIFCSFLVAAEDIIPALGSGVNDDTENTLIIPRYLKPGDLIGITSCAGYITLLDIQPAMQQMEAWGFKIRVGNTIGKRDFTFGGT